MNKRIILIIGSTETLSYFSKQIGAYFVNVGREVFYWDMLHPVDSIECFEKLPNKSDSILITFNFIGLCGESQFLDGFSNIWDEYEIEKICIMVDSPIYYYRQLSSHMRNLKLVCIDRNHVLFVKKWHPEYETVIFLPLCGNLPIEDMWLKPGIANSSYNCSNSVHINQFDIKPLKDRDIDFVFVGNYVTIDSILPSIADANPEYKDFIFDVADSIISHPERVLEEEIYKALKEALPDEDENDYPNAMFHMIFIDLYVRTFFRSKMIKDIVEAGYKIHICGQDWDKLDTDRKDNLIYTNGMVTSADCVRAISNSKISLNIMPMFKAGAHDRIFTSMLAGSVAVTDSSTFLDEILTPFENYVPFVLGNNEGLINNIDLVINDDALAQRIADNGRIFANENYTWKHFAYEIEKHLDSGNE